MRRREVLGQDRDEARDILVRDRDVEHFVRDVVSSRECLETETTSLKVTATMQ